MEHQMLSGEIPGERQRYTISSGVLVREQDGKPLLRISSARAGQEKRICTMDGKILGNVVIRGKESGHVREREYLLLDTMGKTCAVVRPAYAAGEDPDEAGWPIHRMPTVNRAEVLLNGEACELVMHGPHCYTLTKRRRQENALLKHKGLCGGWQVEACGEFTPKILGAFYVFCRYMERENDFPLL